MAVHRDVGSADDSGQVGEHRRRGDDPHLGPPDGGEGQQEQEKHRKRRHPLFHRFKMFHRKKSPWEKFFCAQESHRRQEGYIKFD